MTFITNLPLQAGALSRAPWFLSWALFHQLMGQPRFPGAVCQRQVQLMSWLCHCWGWIWRSQWISWISLKTIKNFKKKCSPSSCLECQNSSLIVGMCERVHLELSENPQVTFTWWSDGAMYALGEVFWLIDNRALCIVPEHLMSSLYAVRHNCELTSVEWNSSSSANDLFVFLGSHELQEITFHFWYKEVTEILEHWVLVLTVWAPYVLKWGYCTG